MIDAKKARKALGRLLGRIGLGFFTGMIKLMPGGMLYAFARKMGGAAFFCAGKQRKTALEGLQTAFGNEKSPAQLEDIAKECFVSMAKGGLELLYLMDRPALLKQRVAIAGRENLEQALAKGKGAILVSAHFGNFPLLLAKLSLEGYKAAGIMRFMRDEKIEKVFSEKRSRLGIKTIYSQPRKVCVEESIRTLRDNGLLFIPIDQNFGTGGVFVNFFGRKAATATGPVVLARRTKAAILPCFIVRNADDTHQIIFEPQLELNEGGLSQEASITEGIQKLTDIIEKYIRIYPAEWGWIHRRWKSKQSEPSIS